MASRSPTGSRRSSTGPSRCRGRSTSRAPDRPPRPRPERPSRRRRSSTIRRASCGPSRLPAYLLLGNVRNLPDGLRQARELLAPVLVGREDASASGSTRSPAVLSSPSLAEAAARLGVHRNTVAYRVQRLEALGDWDLSDPELRFALMLAVRVMQDAQDLTQTGTEPQPGP